jgi:hypothetical protein
VSHLHRMIEMDAARIRAVDQAAFRLGFALGCITGAGFGAFALMAVTLLR